jgi:hypothetical protein
MAEHIRVLALSLVALSGCATVHATQEPKSAPAVASATVFYVRPLQFHVAQAWENPQKWAAHVGAWQQAYWDGLRDSARRLNGRQLQFVAADQPLGDGVIVDANVSAIRRSTVGIGADHIEGEVVFVDARSGERLLTARVDANSDRFGPEGWTFGGRVKLCSLNLADSIVTAMRSGEFPQ